ncbi:HlyD family secretion protein [Lignipirellula cremea]|uniref:Putative efflux pump membrane fusion protein n=1 Tax=Lignipirellula cremea TaxID=2528010 RepID=A0A518DUP6_9BACT|nr:HlyD family efflux transporter periplasmic adaptor subunit [Lignipirellula cremea]QDU95544.1 putative efflux pump membrane fusion protein [Lignipirellula cremea]
MNLASITLLAAVAIGGPFNAERPAVSVAEIPHCLVSIDEQIDAPALESGPLAELGAQDGQYVQAGALLAQIDDNQSRLDKQAAELERDAAITRANDDIEVRFAVASLEVADAEVEQALEVNRKRSGVVTETELRRLKLARHRADLQIDRSRLDQKVAQMTAQVQQAVVKSAEASIERRQILAPFQGQVLVVHRRKGEWVNAGDPVLTLARLDRLRVEGFLNANEFSPAEIAGRKVTIQVQLERGRVETFSGVVAYVNPVVQAGNKYRVRALVENRVEKQHYLLRPGVEASMSIDLR